MGRKRTSFTEAYAQSLSATWFLIATHCVVIMIICVKLFLNITMHDDIMGRARFWNTNRVNLYAPFRHFIAGNKEHLSVQFSHSSIAEKS